MTIIRQPGDPWDYRDPRFDPPEADEWDEDEEGCPDHPTQPFRACRICADEAKADAEIERRFLED